MLEPVHSGPLRKVAVLFDNFGPYHIARLNAAGRVCELLAVESAGSSGEYAWEKTDSERSFQTATLFPDSASRTVSLDAFSAELQRTLNAFKPEVLFVPGWSGRAAFIAVQWAVNRGVPIVVMSESNGHDEVRSAWREQIKQWYLRLSSAGLAGGSPQACYLAELGVSRDRIFLGYDAVDNGYFANGAEAARENAIQLRSKLRLPENYFLASARFIPKKNLTRLIEAYAGYRERVSQSAPGNIGRLWDLVLLGDGELRESIVTQIKNSDLTDHVHLPGFVQYPDLPTYYGLAGAFIHASTMEQWGLVVNEAMASGLPVLVSSRCGCAEDLVEEGVNGWTFDPTDVATLTQNLMQLASLPLGEREQVGRASQEIISRWGPERFASGLLQAAECALQQPCRKAGFATRLFLRLLTRLA